MFDQTQAIPALETSKAISVLAWLVASVDVTLLFLVASVHRPRLCVSPLSGFCFAAQRTTPRRPLRPHIPLAIRQTVPSTV